MKLKFFILGVFLFTVSRVGLSAPLHEPKVLETQDITHILEEVDRNTLVVFNIDYTLFHSTTQLGSPEWHHYLIQQELKSGNTRENSFNLHYDTWVKSQQFNEIELMDLRIPKLLKDLKRKSLGFIALTQRQGSTAEITRWQLTKFDLDFSKSSVSDLRYQSAFKYPGFYRDGILFAHDFNEKGKIFFEWMQQASSQSPKVRAIRTVIFVDDSLKNITSVAEACQKLGIDFVGYRYSLGDVFKKRFNPNLVETEKEILLGNHSDSETRLLLENAGSYTDQRLIQQKIN